MSVNTDETEVQHVGLEKNEVRVMIGLHELKQVEPNFLYRPSGLPYR